MATVKPAFTSPKEPYPLDTVLPALEREERFADTHEFLGFLARVVRREHRTPYDRMLRTFVPSLVTVELESQPSIIKNRKPLIQMLRNEFEGAHLAVLEQDVEQGRLNIDQMPNLLFTQGRKKLSAVTDVRTMPGVLKGEDLYIPPRLAAYCGELLIGARPHGFVCDIAAMPDEDMRKAVRQYDL